MLANEVVEQMICIRRGFGNYLCGHSKVSLGSNGLEFTFDLSAYYKYYLPVVSDFTPDAGFDETTGFSNLDAYRM